MSDSPQDSPPSYDDAMVGKCVLAATASPSAAARPGRIEELKKAVADYQPGETIRIKRKRPRYPPKATRVGLFGAPGVGKSALINSLLYVTAPDNIWRHAAPEAFQTQRSMTIKKAAYDLTEGLSICDNRGMVDFGGRVMAEVSNQIAGVREDGSYIEWDHGWFMSLVAKLEQAWSAKEECQIHCAIIVASAEGLMMRPSDMKELIQTIIKMTGEPPIFVITHKKSTPNPQELDNFKAGLRDLKIEYVHEIENYTSKDHGYDDEKHMELLEILNDCTMVSDRVMMHAEKQESSCILL